MSSTKLPIIPETAPFTLEQRAWLNGFFAGIYSQSEKEIIQTAEKKVTPITILYGSQTGTSEALANEISDTLIQANMAPTIYEMDNYNIADLEKEKMAILITSTYGDGEPPDNAKEFFSKLALLENSLASLKYAVVGLGDSNYEKFCKAAIDLDGRLQALGASPVLERIDCDVDYDELFYDWLKELPKVFSSDSKPISQIELKESQNKENQISKKNPYEATLLENKLLNEGSSKEIRHFSFDLKNSGLHYLPGDALGVFAENDSAEIKEFILAIGHPPSCEVKVKDKPMSLEVALTKRLDIKKINKDILKYIADQSKSEKLLDLLQTENSELLKDFIAGKEIIDMLLEFEMKGLDLQKLISCLKPIAPRLYSIASSNSMFNDQVHLTVGVVRYSSSDRKRKGLCSSYLADKAELMTQNKTVKIFLHPNKNFKLPQDSSKDIIMVGPGTGIAPFRSFIQERATTKSSGKNWLFFGDRNEKHDFIYKEEIMQNKKDGVLNKLSLAFSRDQEQKIYVQHKMLENAQQIFDWLENGAYFYVCGDASKMANDVEAALKEIIRKAGNLDDAQTESYIRKLKSENRYQRDVY